jgi:hypothetical protein
MYLTITTTHTPATDLGYLLHKRPGKLHSVSLSFGQAHVFESESPKANSPEIAAEHSGASTSNAPTTHDPAPPSKYRSYWATIPDPTKKPS